VVQVQLYQHLVFNSTGVIGAPLRRNGPMTLLVVTLGFRLRPNLPRRACFGFANVDKLKLPSRDKALLALLEFCWLSREFAGNQEPERRAHLEVGQLESPNRPPKSDSASVSSDCDTGTHSSLN
jgi:hypothetical protein